MFTFFLHKFEPDVYIVNTDFDGMLTSEQEPGYFDDVEHKDKFWVRQDHGFLCHHLLNGLTL